jgi:CcmD family protein
MDNFGYLFAAYTIIFAVIFLYVMFIWRRQSRLERELRAIEAQLKDVREELRLARYHSRGRHSSAECNRQHLD